MKLKYKCEQTPNLWMNVQMQIFMFCPSLYTGTCTAHPEKWLCQFRQETVKDTFASTYDEFTAFPYPNIYVATK